MNRPLFLAVGAASLLIFLAGSAHPGEITPDRDNLDIAADATIRPGIYRIADADDNGVVRITGDNVTVDFQGATLDGSAPSQAPDSFGGTGIVITGQSVTLRNVKVRGFKVGIYARGAAGLAVEDVDVSGNYARHLQSTPQREDLTDWISPHLNDQGQWRSRYGAGLYVEGSDRVTLRRVRARHGQNGIILDRVNDSKVCENDCSFLSGWGLAMWRSSRNVITRNAFDFCVRGYSHGVYNRGQDSAGILMFEQNNDNVIAENSATHGGDGLFGFGGTESLAGAGRTGNNGNLIIGNDFSYAAAHGIEMTFSFDNRIIANRMTGNAICGVWGGYSQDTLIAGNTFEGNGEGAYGSERGGVNIEHGRGNLITHNTFRSNKCGVYLWSDADSHLMDEPWIKANHKGSAENTISHNVFSGDLVAIQLHKTTATRLVSNAIKDVPTPIEADSGSQPQIANELAVAWKAPDDYPLCGDARQVGARDSLAGRDKIIVTEWGPYDYESTAILPSRVVSGSEAVFQVLAPRGAFTVAGVTGDVTVSPMEGALPALLTVKAAKPDLRSFQFNVETAGQTLSASGCLLNVDWTVRFFGWSMDSDPRTQPEGWQRVAAGPPLDEIHTTNLDFDWALGNPTERVPSDRFGTVAAATVTLPAGDWKIVTISDDGIRVLIDGAPVIDDWTWHPPKENSAVVPLSAGSHHFRVEHFEIDGYAQLSFTLEPASP